jgi:hypothetical protein
MKDKKQKNKKSFLSLLLGSGLIATMLSSTALAQVERVDPRTDPGPIQEKPVIRTYESAPTPDSSPLEILAEGYEDSPDPQGYDSKETYIRYDEANDANDDQRYKPFVIIINDEVDGQ